MEDRKTGELNDEALDAVAGGATCKYDMITNRWFVYRQDGSYYADYSNRFDAVSATARLSEKEAEGSFVPPSISIPHEL